MNLLVPEIPPGSGGGNGAGSDFFKTGSGVKSLLKIGRPPLGFGVRVPNDPPPTVVFFEGPPTSFPVFLSYSWVKC